MKKILLFIIFCFSFLSQVEAFDFYRSTYILQNRDTWEMKYYDNVIWWTENIILQQFEKILLNAKDWEKVFENWSLICFYIIPEEPYHKKSKCEYIWEIKSEVTLDDLSNKDHIKIIISIMISYLWLFIICFPFNFFVFFGISYIILWWKVSLKMHMIIIGLLTIIVDLILWIIGLNYMQLVPVFFWIVVYFPFVFLPKFVFALFWIYKFVYYKKMQKISSFSK